MLAFYLGSPGGGGDVFRGAGDRCFLHNDPKSDCGLVLYPVCRRHKAWACHPADSYTPWDLPLFCDLAGKQTFTQPPTVSNTGVLIQKTVVQEEARNIYISLVVTQSAWTLTPERSQCKHVVITSTQGVHPVFYKEGSGKTFPISYAEFNNDSEVLKNGQ